MTLSGQIVGGNSSITKIGAGTLVLTNNLNNQNGTNLNAGTIQVQASQALGFGTLAMADGTTLQSGASDLLINNAITLDFTVVFCTGTFSTLDLLTSR